LAAWSVSSLSLGRFFALSLFLAGCTTAAPNLTAVDCYYRYDFSGARDALRGDAYLANDEQVVLDNLRLGMAALADGDLDEAERALLAAFQLLSTAGLNHDRTTAAVLLHEGVRIWKGEPFEQALAYHYVATLYALRGDFENARAAAANAMFRLRDFGGDPDFALGLLMLAIATERSGLGGAEAQLRAALRIDPDLAGLVEVLRAGAYDTLLLVDYGRGPDKIATGPHGALADFSPRHGPPGPLRVWAGSTPLGSFDPVCDVNEMARDYRWNDLEQVRLAKASIGDAMVLSGSMLVDHGRARDSGRTVLGGAGLVAAGHLTRANAHADVRQLEFLPQTIFLAPLALGQTTDVRVQFAADPAASMVVPDLEPGTTRQPRVVYLRLHGGSELPPPWLVATSRRYSNDHAGAPAGAAPWILGGRDVSTPNRDLMQTYRADGVLTRLTLNDLLELYRGEEIHIGSGRENRPGVRRNPSYRHILEGGTGLFTPYPYSMGYKRLMFQDWPAYPRRTSGDRSVATAGTMPAPRS
jgi:tetratricopeptide (TPR) repeat protein